MAELSQHYSLPALGWRQFFQQQLSQEELETTVPMRVVQVHRKKLRLAGDEGEVAVFLTDVPVDEERSLPTVGDWALYSPQTNTVIRRLERQSLYRRMASGARTYSQNIAANVDTLFIVSSCNSDFNLNRLERYLSLAFDAGSTPVLVLTKADLADNAESLKKQALSLHPSLAVEVVNALSNETAAQLAPWCTPGTTIALLGSSGVGKSTLLNTINGEEMQKTGGIREKDAKGKHTTTSRSLYLLGNGALLLDCPGMRELQLLDCAQGVNETFEEFSELAASCRFNNCTHTTEPDCALKAAVADGTLDKRRFENYLKLFSEQEKNIESLTEQRKRQRSYTKYVKAVSSHTRKKKRR